VLAQEKGFVAKILPPTLSKEPLAIGTFGMSNKKSL
jgi:hypothetical protein